MGKLKERLLIDFYKLICEENYYDYSQNSVASRVSRGDNETGKQCTSKYITLASRLLGMSPSPLILHET